ncbi:MAG: ExbD/TolR family protein [Chthoniobacterales bacterium]
MAGGGVSEDGDVGFQIAPMVDVVFVLLLFFMASAGSQIIEKELNINLPSGRSGPSMGEAPPPPVIISIMADGTVLMNDRPFDSPGSKELPELRAWLIDNIDRFGDKIPVIIKPEDTAVHGRIIDVLNAASAARVKNLTFG